MNGVLSLIFMLSLNSLDTNITYCIANYIIDHVKDIEDKNIREISKDSYTSTTSIIKFCHLLGFNSYNEFKSSFVFTYKDRLRQLHRKLNDEKVDELFNQINYLSESKIDKDTFLDNLMQLVKVIHEQKAIYFYGAVFPLNLAMSFGEDMTIMGVPVHFIQCNYGMDKIANQFGVGVDIIITYTGRFIEQRRFQYLTILEHAQTSVLISKEHEYIDDVDIAIPLPNTKSIDYDDLVLLLIFDIIKFLYFTEYFQ